MIRRIIHIASPACLSVRCRQLVIRGEESDETVVPLEDVATIVIDHPQTSLTASVLGYCGEIGICVVHCGFDRMPSALSVPIVTNARSGYHLSEQLAVSIPNKKRLWALIVREKILAQSSVLALYGRDDDGLVGIADSVRSGDTDNAEWIAAAKYFRALLGDEFVRERGPKTLGINAWMNYGYAVIRALIARSIVSAGLHPSIGIWHDNGYNYFNLADDLIEPLRPLVDRIAYGMLVSGVRSEVLTVPMKRELVSVLTHEIRFRGMTQNMTHLADMYVLSLRAWYSHVADFSVPDVSGYIRSSFIPEYDPAYLCP